MPHAVPLRRRWNADVCVEARPPQAEHPEEHLRHGALQEHGQESHHGGPQHCTGHTAPEQHHVSPTDRVQTGADEEFISPCPTPGLGEKLISLWYLHAGGALNKVCKQGV